jgi:hypothetical protein
MRQEVIQDFLNLPGIVGFALMDGRSRPYFYGVDQTLNFQQKEVLAQGILQVVETIPEGFESFKFQFAGHQVYLYKVEEIVLLVLTDDELVYADYLQTIKNLKASFREDINNAIAKFRLIAGTLTQSTSDQPLAPPESPQAPPRAPQGAQPILNAANSPDPPLPDLASLLSENSPSPPEISLKDGLDALNQLGQFTTRYLGTQIIVNYWKTTRPPHPWLQNFQIDRAGHITFACETPAELQQPISLDQQLWLQEWVATFIKRCTQIVRDFPDLIRQTALTDEQKTLLLG